MSEEKKKRPDRKTRKPTRPTARPPTWPEVERAPEAEEPAPVPGPETEAPEVITPAEAPVERRRVLFIHPSFPNQFTAIAAELGKQPDFECLGLVHQGFAPAVVASGAATPHFGFLPDGQVSDQIYPYVATFESSLRNAAGIARALLAMKQAYRLDAVVGHAAFGASLYLRSLLDCAIISYAELPSFQTAAARPEFPYTLDHVFIGHVFEAMIYGSVLNSDLCIVPSEHARRLFPPELQPKLRVQMEGFDIEHLPPGGQTERAALGLPATAQLVGFFGRSLEAVRGFDIFVQVAERLYERDQTLRFVIIGDDQTLYGNETLYLGGQSFMDYTLARSRLPAEAIHWRRALPYEEFRRHLACLDLAILPVFEGAANWSLFEAMAAGLPILSSDRAFVPEVIRNGQEGVLLNPYDAAGFAEEALKLLGDQARARALGRAAQDRIRQNYTTAHAVAGYRRIIEEAIELYRARRG